jgi:nucleoside triphosphate diphosphatase
MPNSHTLQDLLDIMARLRAPDGCPWDKEQTHESLLSCFIEETFEFIDAVERKDLPNMAEELGDVLLQVVFHCQMAAEAGHFNFADIANGIAEKLVRRHPHVFGTADASSSGAVQVQWDAIKAAEKAEKAAKAKTAQEAATSEPTAPEPESALGQIPRGLPALAKAQKIQKRAATVGFDWPDHVGPLAKVYEELQEFEVELAHLKAAGALHKGDETPSRAMAGEHPTPDAARARLESEYGDMLFALVNLGRHLEIDPERALSATNQRFVDRFTTMEKLARQEGGESEAFAKLSLDAKEALWQKAKAITSK